MHKKTYKILLPSVTLLLLFTAGCSNEVGSETIISDSTEAILQQSETTKSSSYNGEKGHKKPSSVEKKTEISVKNLIDDSVKQLYQEQVDLETENDAALSRMIEEEMISLTQSFPKPSRYTVYIENLSNPQKKTYVSNWSPARSQFSASTIKLYILIAVYQSYQENKLSPETIYTLEAKDIVQGAGIMLYDPLGTTYTIDQLCRLMMVESDNIATNVLIDFVGGFEYVDQVISQIEGENHYSSLQRKMMDTSNIENGLANRIDAKGAVQTLLKLYKGEIFNPQIDAEILKMMSQTKNETKLPAKLPNGAKIYHKTGESAYRGIENDLGIIEYEGEVFGICVLIQVNSEDELPEDASEEQMTSQREVIANIGQQATQLMSKRNTIGQ